jgi:fatty acid desaturase
MTAVAVSPQLATARRPLAAIAKIIGNWTVVAAVFAIVSHHTSWPCVIAGFLIIGVEQHALGLWMHEGIHGLIARNKTWNDVIVAALLTGPLFVPIQAFRDRHMLHHRHLGTPEDTKSVIFTRIDGRHFWLFLLKTCFGLQLVTVAAGYLSTHAARKHSAAVSARRWMADVAAIGITQGVLLGAVSCIGTWTLYLWLWVLPWLTINRLINGLRSVIEHQPLPPQHHPFTRRLRPTMLDRALFCRVGFQYHWTHHCYPNVPYFNLRLLERQHEEPGLVADGYLETLRLLIRSAQCQAYG